MEGKKQNKTKHMLLLHPVLMALSNIARSERVEVGKWP